MEINRVNIFAACIFLFFIFCSISSPLLGFYISLSFLALVGFSFPYRLPICIIAIITGSLIYSSRILGFVSGDDFFNQYYPLYQSIGNPQMADTQTFGGGLEIGLYVFFYIIKNIYSGGQEYVLFCITFFCLALFYIWIEKFFVKTIEPSKRSLCIASAIAFFGLFVTTQLTRQAISTVFILYTISFFTQGDKKKSLAALIIAGTFHLTALPITAVIYIYMYGNSKWKKITLFSIMFFSLFFYALVKIIAHANIFMGIASKFLYYVDHNSASLSNAYYWRHLIVCSLLSLYLFSKNHKEYKNLIIYGTISYLSLVTIPFASDRTMMPLTIYLLGIIVFLSFYKISNIYRYLLVIYCFFRFFQLGPFYDYKCTGAIYCLWGGYNWYTSFL